MPVLIDVSQMPIGEFSQDVRFIHDGVNSPSVITVTGQKVPDNDNDGIPDATDPDDDNDGTADVDDACSFDPTETTDTDNDGIGNNADTDDDDDGLSDEVEIANGLDPLNASDANADNDNDGVSNAIEIANGTNLSVDEFPPEFRSVGGPITVVATGELTRINSVTPPLAFDNTHVRMNVISSHTGGFPVGVTTITYTATDEAGNSATAERVIIVIPYISAGADKMVAEGQTIDVRLTLNASALDSLSYGYADPIWYSSKWRRLSLSTTDIMIEEGTEQTVQFTILDDGLGDNNETLRITFGDLVNAGTRALESTDLAISEDNLPPTLTLSVSQNDIVSRTVNKSTIVYIDVEANDPNGMTSLPLTYSGINGVVRESGYDLSFNPINLDAGVYQLLIGVRDDQYSVEKMVIINIIDGTTPRTAQDADTDNDGIADSVDTITQPNVQAVGNGFASAQEGVTLALGMQAMSAGNTGIVMSESQMERTSNLITR